MVIFVCVIRLAVVDSLYLYSNHYSLLADLRISYLDWCHSALLQFQLSGVNFYLAIDVKS